MYTFSFYLETDNNGSIKDVSTYLEYGELNDILTWPSLKIFNNFEKPTWDWDRNLEFYYEHLTDWTGYNVKPLGIVTSQHPPESELVYSDLDRSEEFTTNRQIVMN